MPGIYSLDNSNAPRDRIASFKAIIKPSTAFHKDAPKSNESIFSPHVPNEKHKIPMPRNEDHGWGEHIAKTRMETRMRTTPFKQQN